MHGQPEGQNAAPAPASPLESTARARTHLSPVTAGTSLGQTRGATNPRGRRAGEDGWGRRGHFGDVSQIEPKRDVATGESFLGGQGSATGLVLPRGSWWERGLEHRAALQPVLNPVPFTPHVQRT